MFYKNEDYKVWNVSIEGDDKYFIQFYVQAGKNITCEINADCFKLYLNEFNKPLERQKNECRRKRAQGVSYEDLTRVPADRRNLVDIIAPKQDLSKVLEIVNSCTQTQRRRFYMRYIDELTLDEIAAVEGCNKSAVRRSINYIFKKLALTGYLRPGSDLYK